MICEKHQWKMWLPNGIYQCGKCGLFKLFVKGETK